MIENYLSTKKNRSGKPMPETSKRIYRHELGKFTAFLAAGGKDITQAGAADLDAYHADMTRRNMKPASMKRAFSMITGFLKHLSAENPEYTAPVSKRGELIRYSSPGYADGERFVKLLNRFGAWIPTGKTRAAYIPAVRRFFSITGKTPSDITHDDILKWVQMLHQQNRAAYGRDMSVKTIRVHLAAVTKFNRFLKLQNHAHISHDLLMRDSVNLPRQSGRQRPETLTPGEIRIFLETIRKARTKIAARDHALFSLIFCCALRVGEAVNMKTGHIAAEPRRATVSIRGRKNRRHIIQQMEFTDGPDLQLLKSVTHWAEMAGTGENEPLFCPVRWSRREQAHVISPGTGIRERAMEKRFRIWSAASGIRIAAEKGIHILRHSRATDLIRHREWDLAAVRNFMGHSNIAVTDIYLN